MFMRMQMNVPHFCVSASVQFSQTWFLCNAIVGMSSHKAWTLVVKDEPVRMLLTPSSSSFCPSQLKSFCPMRDILCLTAAATQWQEETWLASCSLCSTTMHGSRRESPWLLNEEEETKVDMKKRGCFTKNTKTRFTFQSLLVFSHAYCVSFFKF